jgi:serine/threonine protein kinase
MDTDRNLLFAVLALQVDLLDRDRFVRACTLWAAHKDRPIADLLIDQGWLTPDDRADVERLLARKLKKHGGDVQASLGEAAGAEVRGTLASIADAQVEGSIAALADTPTRPSGVPRAAEDYSTVPPADCAGRNILYEEIGRGGIGRVLRGRDPELRRDLAVKVLRDEYRDDVTVQRRFVEEAQVGGQLQHPGLVPIYELGRFADQRPYFTMKLVKGRTLAELLKERPDVLHDLPRFLTVFEQVCQTVAYAHSKRVIHRDLKPSNVMVGNFGEVQVMDWGLAKVLANREVDPEATTAGTLIRTARSDSTAEEAGRTGVVGTPAYMAPEQARGEVEAVDERADVFGLGGILCVILTGQPPFAGADQAEVLRQAAAGNVAEAFGRLDGCRADADLMALCKECLAPHRAERPRDAGEVAARMAAYQSAVQQRLRQAELERAAAEAREAEQRRRRRMLLTASGVIALVLLAGLSVSMWQMFRAIDAEGQAKQNAQQAEDEATAKALALAAEQQAREDETKARQQAFAALRSMTADVVEKKFAQGTVLTEEDRAFLRGIIAQFDAFAEIKGDDTDSRAVRAEGRFRVGWMRSRLGELKEAESDWDQALSIYNQLAADFPTTQAQFRQQLARSHINRGNLVKDTGRLQEAEKDYDQAIRIFKQLAADFPSRPEFRQELALSHSNRGLLLSATGRLQEAEKDYDQALSLAMQLAADFPNRPEFRQELAGSRLNRGSLLYTTGRLQEAEKDWNEALSIQKQLAADFPNRPEFRQVLAGSHNNRGSLLRATGRLQEAEKDWNEALSIQKQLAAEFPSRPELRRELASSHNNRSALLYTTGRLQEAEKDWNEALRIQKQLAADFQTHPEFRQELAGSLYNRGNLLRDTGRLQEARKDYDQALSIRKQLAADFPSRPEFRQDLASSHNSRGALLYTTGRLQEAEKDWNEALSIQKQLAADFPNRPEFRQDLASSHNSRGGLLYTTGRLQEAEKDWNEALSIQKQLAADFPNQPDQRNALAGACVNLAILHQQQGNWAAAKRLLLEGRPHHLAALKANPRNPTYRQFYRNHLNVLTTVHAGLLEQDDASCTAEACRDLGWNAPADAYNAACLLSECIPIVAKHYKLDDKQRKEAARFYGDAAMKLLREAVSKGYKDVPNMKKETDLDPLRQREDFQKLIAELEGKGK